MTATTPTGFTPLERELVQMALHERYGRIVTIQDVEVALQIDPATPLPTTCNALYWQASDAEFVVAKIVRTPNGIPTYRTQFFYGDDEAYSTSQSEYGNLGDCVVSVLQVQATHEAERNAPAKGKLAPQPEITGDENYDGPLVI